MNKEQAQALMVALGGKVTSTSDNWVRGPCVLAPWTHQSGKDSNPSFGLNYTQGEPGRFHCFSCESGSLSKLLQTIEFHVLQSPGKFHGSMQKAREIVEQEEIDLPVLQDYQEFDHGQKKQLQPLPDYWLESFKPVHLNKRAVAYIEYRGFTLQECEQWDIRYDHLSDMLVFPYRDVFGRLAGARGRGVQFPNEYHSNAHYDYTWNDVNNSSLCWFNEPVLDSAGPIVIVEGQFDALRVARVYPRVMANLTAKPVLEKMTKLSQADGVILMLDGDLPGRKATEKFTEFLDFFKVPTAVVLLPTEDDQGQPIKTDPDKLGEAWITKALQDIGLIA